MVMIFVSVLLSTTVVRGEGIASEIALNEVGDRARKHIWLVFCIIRSL